VNWWPGCGGGLSGGAAAGLRAGGRDGVLAAGTAARHRREPGCGLARPRLNDAQAGLGDGASRLSGLIAATLTTDGDGYCIPAILQARPDTRDLLAVVRQTAGSCLTAIPERDDFVHYDFTLANLLSDGTAITGVIDINPPVLAGDRAFDLATLLFYLYDQDEIRDLLRARLLDLAGPQAACAYLAHMVLRQVDWSLRFHPAAAATRRHLHLARLVTADIGHRLAR
jgi:hypothetical protein